MRLLSAHFCARRKQLAESLAIRHDYNKDAINKDSLSIKEIASIATDAKTDDITKFNGTAYTALEVWSPERIQKKAQDYASKNTTRVLKYYVEICEGKAVADKMKAAVLDGTHGTEAEAFAAYFQDQANARKDQSRLARSQAKAKIAAKSDEAKAAAAASQSDIAAKVAARRYIDDEAEEGGDMNEDEPSSSAAAAEIGKKTAVAEKILDSMQRLSPEEQAFVAESLGWRKAVVASTGTSSAIKQIRSLFSGHVADLDPATESGQRQIINHLGPLGPLGIFKVIKALL